MEAKGGDPELIKTYRAYVPGALVSEIAATDAKTLVSAAISWIISTDGGLSLLVRIGTIIGSLFLLLLVARAVRSVAPGLSSEGCLLAYVRHWLDGCSFHSGD